MKKKIRSIVSILLAIAMLTAAAAVAMPAKADSDTVSFVDIDSYGDFERYLTSDDSIGLNITKDIAYSTDVFRDFLITAGRGTKVIELNGHSVSCYLYKDSNESSVMILVPEGSSVIVNDSKGGGEISYDAGDPVSSFFAQRTVFRVHKGELTVNGGTIIAGHNNDLGDGRFAFINGCAVADTGTFTMNGGCLIGRGSSYSGGSVVPNAALHVYGAKAYINDGTLIGEGSADAVFFGGSSKFSILSGDMHTETVPKIATDCEWVDTIGGPRRKFTLADGVKGKLGFRLTEYPTADTKMYIDEKEVDFDYDFMNSTADLKVRPNTERRSGFITVNGTGSIPEKTDWNRADPFPFTVSMRNSYFPWQNVNDGVTHTRILYVSIYEKDTGKPVLTDLAMTSLEHLTSDGDMDAFDMSEFLTAPMKGLLEQGHDYTFMLYMKEHWSGANDYYINTTYPQVADSQLTVHITEPKPLDSVNIILDPPKDGEKPDRTADSENISQYTATVSDWYLAEGSYPRMGENDTFEEGKPYRVRMNVVPQPGYAFTKSTNFTVNGQKTTFFVGLKAERAGIQADMKAEEIEKTYLEKVSCTVTPPKPGEHPDMTAISSEPDKYTAEVEYWYHNVPPYDNVEASDTFANGTVYAVRVKICPKKGYIVDLDTETVINGIQSDRYYFNNNNIGLQLLMNCTNNVTLHEAGGLVEVPQAGEHPDYMPVSAEKAKYDVTNVCWYVIQGDDAYVMSAGEEFKAGGIYMVDLTFTALEGYEFNGATEFYINGEKCESGSAKYSAAAKFYIEGPAVLGIYGDVDSDGDITAADALMILRASAGLDEYDVLFGILADVDGDEAVTASDALAVLRYSVGAADEGTKVGKEAVAYY